MSRPGFLEGKKGMKEKERLTLIIITRPSSATEQHATLPYMPSRDFYFCNKMVF